MLLHSKSPTLRSDHIFLSVAKFTWLHRYGVNGVRDRVKLNIWGDCLHLWIQSSRGSSLGFSVYLEIAGVGGCGEINIQQRCTQVKGHQCMTAWINIVPCSATITAHEQVVEVIDAPKCSQSHQTKLQIGFPPTWWTSDGLTTGHIPHPPSNGLFYLGFQPCWLALCAVPFMHFFGVFTVSKCVIKYEFTVFYWLNMREVLTAEKTLQWLVFI